MKKIFLSLVMVTVMITTAMAQPRAIGARLGGNFEVSYQHDFASRNMVDLTVGAGSLWHYGYLDANCMFDWLFNISGGWNWYVGPGFGLGWYWGDNYYGKHPVRLNLGAQIGVEYQFNIPLNLSLDFRPMTNLLGYGGGDYYLDWWNVALGIRYRF